MLPDSDVFEECRIQEKWISGCLSLFGFVMRYLVVSMYSKDIENDSLVVLMNELLSQVTHQ